MRFRGVMALAAVLAFLAGCGGGGLGGAAGAPSRTAGLAPPPPPALPERAAEVRVGVLETPSELALHPGWNLVAFPVGLVTAVSPGPGIQGSLFAWEAAAGTYAAVGPTPAEVNAGAGTARAFWVFASQATTLGYEGSGSPPPAPLAPGWNMVAMPGLTAGQVQIAGAPGDLAAHACLEIPAPTGCRVYRRAFPFDASGVYAEVDLGVSSTALPAGLGMWVFSHEAQTLEPWSEPVLRSVRIEAAPATLAPGREAVLRAVGVYSDSSERDLSTRVEWSSDDLLAVTVNRSGRAVGIMPGQATLTAREAASGLQGQAGIETVSAPPPVSQTILLTAGSDNHSGIPFPSAPAHRVTFPSQATNLVPGPAGSFYDILWWKADPPGLARASGTPEGLPADGFTSWPALSADGLSLSFESQAPNLGTSTRSVYVRDLPSGVLERVSVSSSGQEADGASYYCVLSADGRLAVFCSRATNLVPGDTNGFDDVFVRDRVAGTTERIGASGAQPDGTSWDPVVTPDGRYVAWVSGATNLVPGDTNGRRDAFRFDRLTGQTVRVSLNDDGSQSTGDVQFSGGNQSLAMSADGDRILYVASFSTAPYYRLCLRRLSAGRTVVLLGTSQVVPQYLSVSLDGRYAGFLARAGDVLGGTSTSFQAFVRDLDGSAVALASATPSGQMPDGDVFYARLSGDGRTMALSSMATDLAPGDTNGAKLDVFLARNPLLP